VTIQIRQPFDYVDIPWSRQKFPVLLWSTSIWWMS